jgi:hypothetical protein
MLLVKPPHFSLAQHQQRALSFFAPAKSKKMTVIFSLGLVFAREKEKMNKNF